MDLEHQQTTSTTYWPHIENQWKIIPHMTTTKFNSKHKTEIDTCHQCKHHHIVKCFINSIREYVDKQNNAGHFQFELAE